MARAKRLLVLTLLAVVAALAKKLIGGEVGAELEDLADLDEAKVCGRGVFGLQPTVIRVGFVGFTPALKGGTLALKKDSPGHK